MDKIRRICVHCGNAFYTTQKDIKRGRGKHCSKACFYADHTTRTRRNCKKCGKEFFVIPSKIKANRGIYCSKECQTLSDEWKDNIKKNHANVKGSRHWFYGKHFTEEHKRNLSEANKGKILSDAQKKLLSDVNKGHLHNLGKKHSMETRIKISNGHRGLHPTPETLLKLSKARKGLLAGQKNPQWLGGVSFEPYCPKFTKALKAYVRAKFNHKCVLGGEPENGKKLCVHHIDYNKLQGCMGHTWALIPLCDKCHTKTNYNRWFWFSKLINYWAIVSDINFETPSFCDLTIEFEYSGIYK